MASAGCYKKNDLPLPLDKNLLFAGFEPQWKLYLESSKGGWKNNDNGRFSNDDAPAMESLLEFYKLTRDQRYLDTLVRVAQRILTNDDVSRSTADAHRGNMILPGWSSTRYTHDSSRTIFIYDDALILLSLVKTFNELKNTNLITVYPVQSWLNRAILEFEAVFKPEWKSINASAGYFEDRYYTNIGLNMPLNQFSIVGLFCLELYKATGNSQYLLYATKSANFLKQQLKVKVDSYVWYYKLPSQAYPDTIYDDFSHAQHVLRFMVEMHEHGSVFNKEDISRLVSTFETQVMDGSKVFQRFGGMLNEVIPLPLPQRYAVDPWLTYFYLLVPYSSKTALQMQSYQTQRRVIYHSNSDYNHLGEFLLLHYAYRLKYLH